MEKANKITSIILKLVGTIAIIAVSFFYCYNSENDRFSLPSAKMLVLDKKTGAIYVPGKAEGIDYGQHWSKLVSFPN